MAGACSRLLVAGHGIDDKRKHCGAFSFCAFAKVLSSFVFGLPKAASLPSSIVHSVIVVKQTAVDRQIPWSKLPPSIFLQMPRDCNFKVFLFGFWIFWGWRVVHFPGSYTLSCAEGSSGQRTNPKNLESQMRGS